jgi:hypothetical protein
VFNSFLFFFPGLQNDSLGSFKESNGKRKRGERELKYQKAKRHAPGKPIEKLTGPWRKSTQLQGGKNSRK